MVRTTYQRGMAIVITTPTRILTRNPYRVYYTIFNTDNANYVTFGPKNTVTAGVYNTNEGMPIEPRQPVTDLSDKDEVWCVANTDTVNIVVTEVSEIPRMRNRK